MMVDFMSSPSILCTVSLEGAIHRSRDKISEVQKNSILQFCTMHAVLVYSWRQKLTGINRVLKIRYSNYFYAKVGEVHVSVRFRQSEKDTVNKMRISHSQQKTF